MVVISSSKWASLTHKPSFNPMSFRYQATPFINYGAELSLPCFSATAGHRPLKKIPLQLRRRARDKKSFERGLNEGILVCRYGPSDRPTLCFSVSE